MNKESQHYNSFATFLHWLMAFVIIFMIGLGFYMHDLDDSSPSRFLLYQMHKSLGISILVLAVVRILWRLIHRNNFRDHNFSLVERIGSKVAHFALYFLMIALPMSGWVIVSSSSTGIPTLLFSVIPWPHLPFAEGASLAEIHSRAEDAHEALAIIAVALLVLHVCAALKHHYLNKDAVLLRMAPQMARQWPGYFVMTFIGVIALLWVLMSSDLPASAPAPAAESGRGQEQAESSPGEEAGAADEYIPLRGMDITGTLVLDEQLGDLSFEWYQPKSPHQGKFRKFHAHLQIDDPEPENHLLDVDISMADPIVDSEDALSALNSAEWFGVEQFPVARFRSSSVTPAEEGSWRVAGELTIRDRSKEIEFVMATEQVREGVRRLSGEFAIDRRDFDVGTGDWGGVEYVAAKVVIRFNVRYFPMLPPEAFGPTPDEPPPPEDSPEAP